MVKQRMSTADVVGEVACLRHSVLGMRVANVYDANAKTYIIKLSKSGEEGEKALLVLESGVRFHTTRYLKDKADTPSNFTLKLRKHLRTRRLDDVRQLGVDRVVDFSFGTGEACYHLILELYAQGNVILADANYSILTLLRSHRDDDKGLAIMARHAYPVHAIRLRSALTQAQLDAALASADDKQTLRGALASVVPYGPALSEHCTLLAGLRPTRKPKADPLCEEERTALLGGVRHWEAWLDACETAAPEGFISLKRPADGSEAASASGDCLVYDSFDPLILQQNSGQEVLRFPTYNAALDEFYAKARPAPLCLTMSVEGQKAEQARLQAEQAALSKLDRIRIDQTGRAEALDREAKEAEAKAQLIEANAEAVDQAINAVRVALAQGLSWAELERLIRDEAAAGNQVAGLVHALHLDRNAVTLLDSNAESNDETGTDVPTALVEVDLDLNAQQNARAWHSDRKARSAKQAKTLDANKRALVEADKKVQVQLSKVKAVAAVQQLRKPAWFEKFNWFVTSENYLVVSGRDAQQNELLVKRYLRKDDLYVHAELHGASTTVVRNHNPSRPGMALVSQAGTACVCRSQAWDAKIVTSAWWVHAHQVSKSAPSGEYLPTGSFMIRGRKNFLPPHPLIMGLTFLFKLDESCIAGHLGERAPKSAEDDDSLSPDQAASAAVSAAANGEGSASGNAEDVENGVEDIGDDAQGDDSEGTPSEQARHSACEGIWTYLDMTGSRDDAAEDEAAAGNRESTSQLEAFLDSAADPLRARRTSGSQTGSTALTGRGSQVGSVLTGRGSQGSAAGPLDQAAAATAAAALARGKRGKAKKAKEKYAHQDDEDRQLALQFLAPAGGRFPAWEKKDKKEKREARKARKKAGATGDGNAVADRLPTAGELAAAGARLGPRIAAILAEENVELVPEEDKDKLQELDSLTGQPRPDDVLLYAIPMCAPYSAIQSYKLKVKLTPGTQRKGRAGRQAIELLSRAADISGRERELLKAIPEMEVINAMVGNVKLAMPGLSKIKTEARKSKKKGG
ncbi:hypothetical protein COCSUDRAFT_16391 [Coccomyxa subellipsoidea C-169]|uniref:DUF814-domain-containing protein n=1 Tax=Coccomyxa subellipsoidea (strain C-169) TaxID=574566 RepID=I0YWY4_COCSC|nr:hypothetical protein COCSUDRAFT_16391 [Coccomyxa subellipsoidea C-169]EIE22903.1 hypothetical protein COCSUDRAFT_16391 [Coccomyxa subellipsoidea C-169]|eukprot:XP_005647447.1 hypothetical protein COCSUDRAFT_16391 [Coccomyxa subellipsoidea C-169]